MRTLTSSVFLTIVLLASASAAADGFSLDFERARAALNGAAEDISYLERCAEEQSVCSLAAATAHHLGGQTGVAIHYLRLALAQGKEIAASGLAFANLEAGDPLEAYAWAQLALTLDFPSGEPTRRQLLQNKNAILAARALAALDEDRHDQADQRARELLAEWNEVLSGSGARRFDPDAWQRKVRITRQVRPRYPRRFAQRGTEGIVEVHARISASGEVIEVLPVYFTHREFAREAERAFRRWKFEIREGVEASPVEVTMRIDFMLNRR